MTKNRDLKLLIRARMEKTGESFAAARRHIETKARASEDNRPSAVEPVAPGVTTYGPPTPAHNTIKGWRGGGFTPDYEASVDRTQGYRGPASAVLRSRSDHAASGSTQLMQSFLADHYRGRRIALSAWIKSESVTGSCGLWVQLYENQRMLVFANAAPVTGTAAWTRQEVGVDVAPAVTMILIGITLDGAGAAWLSDVEIANGDHVPADDDGLLPVHPRNLSFLD